MRKYLVVLLITLSSLTSFATEKSSLEFNAVPENYGQFEFYIMTAGRTPEVWDRGGHNLLRVKSNDIDVVYNWGVFDFYSGSFIKKFYLGGLVYTFEAVKYQKSYSMYTDTYKRALWQDKINFSSSEKKRAFEKLVWWSKNRTYMYNGMQNNCATILRDLIDYAKKGELKRAATKTLAGVTQREKLLPNFTGFYGVDFIMDMSFNEIVDMPLNYWDATYLPIELTKNLSEPIRKKHNKELFKKTEVLNSYKDLPPEKYSFISPTLVSFSVVFFLVAFWFTKTRSAVSSRTLGGAIFLWGVITGFYGLMFFSNEFLTTWPRLSGNVNSLLIIGLDLLIIVPGLTMLLGKQITPQSLAYRVARHLPLLHLVLFVVFIF